MHTCSHYENISPSFPSICQIFVTLKNAELEHIEHMTSEIKNSDNSEIIKTVFFVMAPPTIETKMPDNVPHEFVIPIKIDA